MGYPAERFAWFGAHLAADGPEQPRLEVQRRHPQDQTPVDRDYLVQTLPGGATKNAVRILYTINTEI